MNCAGEIDAFTAWKNLLCVFYNNTGIIRYWKRKYVKRVRKEAKMELRKYIDFA